jgi:hypothetical protein
MRHIIFDRLNFVGRALKQRWVRSILVLWAILGAWDQFVSQMLPTEWGARVPNLFRVLALTGDLLPWWGWLLVGVLIVAGAAVEYAFRTAGLLGSGSYHRPPDRLSLVELRDEANQIGWQLNNNGELYVLDFVTAFRQSAFDGVFRVWGREKSWSTDRLNYRQMLEEIPSNYWKDYEPDPMSLSAAHDNNFLTRTQSGIENKKTTFLDIHVDRRAALAWLRRDSKKFKGTWKRTEAAVGKASN